MRTRSYYRARADVLDFYFKHVGAVKKGYSYEYMQTPLDQLPIKDPRNNPEIVENISKLVKKLINYHKNELKIQRFPYSYIEQHLQDDEEFNKISITFTKKTTYKSYKINNHYLIEINTTENNIIADNEYMKDYIIMWIEFNLKKGIKKDTDLLIPKNIESIKNILKNVNIDINNNTSTNKDQLENMLNELTYELYSINDEEELKIIKDFLKKFS